jgi:hypothetical protein
MWVRDVLGLDELADAIEGIRRMAVTGEEKRRYLIEAAKGWADAIESKPAKYGDARFAIIRPPRPVTVS